MLRNNVISADKSRYEELNGWVRSCRESGLMDAYKRNMR